MRVGLGQHVVQNASVDIGESKVAPLKTKGKRFVVEAQLMEHRGVEIMNMGPLVCGTEAELVCPTKLVSWLDASSGEPH